MEVPKKIVIETKCSMSAASFSLHFKYLQEALVLGIITH